MFLTFVLSTKFANEGMTTTRKFPLVCDVAARTWHPRPQSLEMICKTVLQKFPVDPEAGSKSNKSDQAMELLRSALGQQLIENQAVSDPCDEVTRTSFLRSIFDILDGDGDCPLLLVIFICCSHV